VCGLRRSELPQNADRDRRERARRKCHSSKSCGFCPKYIRTSSNTHRHKERILIFVLLFYNLYIKDITKNLFPNEQIVWSYTRNLSETEKKSKNIVTIVFLLFLLVIFGFNFYPTVGNIYEFVTGMIFAFIVLSLVFVFLVIVGGSNPSQYFITNMRIKSITYDSTDKRVNVCMFRSFKCEDITEAKIFKSVTNAEIFNLTLVGSYETINRYQTFYESKIPGWAEKLSNMNTGIVFDLTEEGKKIFLDNLKKFKPELRVRN